MDIIINHTADVIQYRECVGQRECPYRSRADYPYQRRGGVTGKAINPGFVGDQDPQRRELREAHRPDLCLHALRAGEGKGREGPRLAQRRHPLP